VPCIKTWAIESQAEEATPIKRRLMSSYARQQAVASRTLRAGRAGGTGPRGAVRFVRDPARRGGGRRRCRNPARSFHSRSESAVLASESQFRTLRIRALLVCLRRIPRAYRLYNPLVRRTRYLVPRAGWLSLAVRGLPPRPASDRHQVVHGLGHRGERGRNPAARGARWRGFRWFRTRARPLRYVTGRIVRVRHSRTSTIRSDRAQCHASQSAPR